MKPIEVNGNIKEGTLNEFRHKCPFCGSRCVYPSSVGSGLYPEPMVCGDCGNRSMSDVTSKFGKITKATIILDPVDTSKIKEGDEVWFRMIHNNQNNNAYDFYSIVAHFPAEHLVDANKMIPQEEKMELLNREKIIEAIKKGLGCSDHRGGLWDCDLQIMDSFAVIHNDQLENLADLILKLTPSAEKETAIEHCRCDNPRTDVCNICSKPLKPQQKDITIPEKIEKVLQEKEYFSVDDLRKFRDTTNDIITTLAQMKERIKKLEER